jgi:hypothetical protein
MTIDSNLVFLLTGTVNTTSTFSQLVNPNKRLSQYIEAIHYYLNKFSNKIVFVENSGFDISKYFSDIEKQQLEIITFLGNSYSPEKGKGYGEMEIFKYAFSNSQFIKQSTHIVKITGRYKILNLEKFLIFFSLYENLDLNIDLSRNLTFSDSRFFIVEKSFFLQLFQYHELLDDSNGFFMEHAVCKATLTSILKGAKYKPFRFYPIYSGKYATKNASYKTNPFYILPRKIKFYFKYVLMSR